MLSSFRLLEILTKQNSGSIAKRRLKFLLISDRAGCTPEVLEMIKDDMIKSISKYMEIDTEGLEIRITKAGDRGAPGKLPILYASIPVRTLYTKGSCL
ncbi:MAG: cell division topological specificity factor MinE [Lachnospiraceae bacterium]|nr:cell division topological specificity factor MinE [Lachnospiraceae bacterium]